MEQSFDVRAMGPHEFAAVVREGENTTHHKVVVGDQLVDELGIVEVDEATIVEQTLAYLLEKQPVTALPHDIDTDSLYRDDLDYLADLRTRLAV